MRITAVFLVRFTLFGPAVVWDPLPRPIYTVMRSQMEGHESSAARGHAELSMLADHFHMPYDITDTAYRLYKLALQHGFTRGRRVNQVGAGRSGWLGRGWAGTTRGGGDIVKSSLCTGTGSTNRCFGTEPAALFLKSAFLSRHAMYCPVYCPGCQVAATCLYIACRQEKKPYMLIDFSDHLSVNVFVLGEERAWAARKKGQDRRPTQALAWRSRHWKV